MSLAQPLRIALAYLSDAPLLDQVVILSVLLTLLPLYPVGWYLRHGWAWRRLTISQGLRPAAKDEYLSLFQRQDKDQATADARFDTFFLKWYGRRHLAVPAVGLLAFVAVTAWLLAAYGLHGLVTEGGPSLLIVPRIAAAALAGAYAFAAYDMIERVTRRDLSPDDLILAGLRLVASVPLGYVVQGVAAPDLGVLFAFTISAFPFAAVAAGFRKLGARQLGWDVGQDNLQERLTLLAGVDLDIADRVKEADIRTISQLAYSDPIQLAMRTNLNFAFCIDLVSQALAWVYLGPKLDTLRAFGLRGAFEFVTLRTEMFLGTEADAPPSVNIRGDVARKLIEDAASSTTVALTRAEFLNVVHQIADDPYATFLVSIYA